MGKLFRDETGEAIVDELQNIADKIGSGGGGSTVYVTPITKSGTNIATITVDGEAKQLFAPNGGGGTTQTIYYAEDNNIYTSADDNADALQTLVNRVSAAGGGVIKFGPGVFKISHIELKIGVSIQGNGYPATKLLHKPNNKTTDIALISIPKYSAFNSIKDIELIGTDHKWVYEDYAYAAKPNYGIEFGPDYYIGINVEPTTKDVDGKEVVWGVAYGFMKKVAIGDTTEIVEAKDDTGTSIRYKWLNIENVMIAGFTGYGLFVTRCFTVFVNGLQAEKCGCGVRVSGSDHWIQNGWFEDNVWEGCIIECGNSVVSNLKVIWNGDGASPYAYNTLVSPYMDDSNVNPYKTDTGSNTCGCVIYGSRMKVDRIEAQDNAFHGIIIGGQYTMADTLLSDGNGWLFGQGSTVSKGATAIQIKGMNVQMDKIAITNYNTGRATPCNKYGFVISYAPNSRINYTVQSGCCETDKVIGTNCSGAVINGTTVS